MPERYQSQHDRNAEDFAAMMGQAPEITSPEETPAPAAPAAPRSRIVTDDQWPRVGGDPAGDFADMMQGLGFGPRYYRL